jgi:HEAT repeat protein
MRDPDEATDGPTDPRVHPEQSPGFGDSPEGLEDIEVDRDITIGEATPRELRAADISPVVEESAAEKLQTLADGDHVERRRAALALGEERPTEAVLDGLIKLGLADGDADVRQFAVESLGELGGERAGDAAAETLDDSDPWVRAEALIALDKIDRSGFEAAIEAALDDEHHAVRRNAAVSLFKLRGEALLDVLLEQTHDDSERVREWAAHLLAGVNDDRAEERLHELADDDGEPKVVRSTAARSIEADPGAFRRQFTGGIENEGTDDPHKSRLNRQPDL